MKKLIILLFASMFTMIGFCQKKAIDSSVYDGWKQIGSTLLSNDGDWSVYVVNPQEGDGQLFIRNNKTGNNVTFERGDSPRLFDNGKSVSFKIKKPLEMVRKYEIDKIKKDKQEKDSMVVVRFSDMKTDYYVGTSKFISSKEGGLVAFSTKYPKEKTCDKDTMENDEEELEKNDDEKKDKPFDFGKDYKLTIINTTTGESHTEENMSKFAISKNGKSVVFDRVVDEKRKVYGADISKDFVVTELAVLDFGLVEGLALTEDGKNIAFIATKDTTKQKKYDIYYGSPKKVNIIVDNSDVNMPNGFIVAPKPFSFTESGELMFGIKPQPKYYEPKKLSKDVDFAFDLWSWQDTLLQTQQMTSAKSKIKAHSFRSIYNPKTNKWAQLTDIYMSSVVMPEVEGGDYAMLRDSYKYTWYSTIDSPTGSDIYVIDLRTNTKELVLEEQKGSSMLSPAGRYILYYDVKTQLWNTYEIATKTKRVVGQDIKNPIYDELMDTPSHARPYGVVGWADENTVLIKDKYDIFSVDAKGVEASVNLTKIGRENKEELSPIRQFIADEDYINLKKPFYLSSFDEVTRDGGFYKLQKGQLIKIVESANIYTIRAKAKDSDMVLFTKESYNLVPDLYISNIDDIVSAKQITNSNPQSADYKWGSVELMSWTDFNGDTVEGLLYLPEGYEKGKKYPTIVYFYERSTQSLNQFHMPQPAWSIIIPSVCVSNDYIVFIPDIKYRIGFPGKSSYDAIVSGTMALIERGISDKENIGLQGQSWGGYAASYLITQTDLYACAAPGTPVVNMTSAYGGIRWSSGMARSFQYERTQSRIGATPWERRDLYIDNSPLFFADRINTPVFIRHCDEDGSVPWYQGIEFYVALRRLGKPVWMINYNGDGHNLRHRYARKDFDTRLYQFLDYYLKDTAMPRWMKEGISQEEKGNEMKMDLVD